MTNHIVLKGKSVVCLVCDAEKEVIPASTKELRIKAEAFEAQHLDCAAPKPPVIKAGEYLIEVFDSNDKRIRALQHKRSYQEALEIARAETQAGQSYRISRCLDNSKYDKWSAE